MAQAVKYIGRTTDFSGKTLWEIVGNLKDYGVGRIFIRNMFQRYPEPCYMRILKVEAQPTPIEVKDSSASQFTAPIPYSKMQRPVEIMVERVFRGVRAPYPVSMLNVSYKTDYRLIPKDQEAKYTSHAVEELDAVRNQKLLPATMDFPPLLHRLIAKETGNPNPQMTVVLNKTKDNFYRIATPDEKPTMTFPRNLGIGKPVSLKLYKGLNLEAENESI